MSLVIDCTLNNDLLQGISKVPGYRKIFKPFFAFLINFDDFDFYPFMDTNFSTTLTAFFS
jgi:hypothetical protein